MPPDKPEQDKVRRLIGELKHTDYYVRRDAAHALGEIKDARAIEPLLELLGETAFPQERPAMESKVKSRASEALAKIGEKSVPALLNALADTQSDPEGRKRYWIIDALGLIQDKRALEPLIHALSSPLRDVQESAIEALGRIRDSQALESLIDVFQNLQPKDGSLYFAAVRALGSIGGEPALQVLEEALARIKPADRYAYDRVHNAIQQILIRQDS